MLAGVMLLWFLLTAFSVIFVAIDILRTPESPVLKWAFILFTAYTGPIGAFLYVLGCREPLPGLHEKYTAVRWRQVLGSTMHCVAGDGLGIVVGAILGGMIQLPALAEIALEYALGFGFGWTIFQALFMKNSVGGSFTKALRKTFIPELVSMNYLMAAMVVVKSLAGVWVPESRHPGSATFWFTMSLALLAGFLAAFPVNGWLVANRMKHGMMTVRPAGPGQPVHAATAHPASHSQSSVSTRQVGLVVSLSFVVLGLGVAFALVYAR